MYKGWHCGLQWFQDREWVGATKGAGGVQILRRDILMASQTSQRVQIKEGGLATLQSMKPCVPLFWVLDTQ